MKIVAILMMGTIVAYPAGVDLPSWLVGIGKHRGMEDENGNVGRLLGCGCIG